jgi:hypothetical protein
MLTIDVIRASSRQIVLPSPVIELLEPQIRSKRTLITNRNSGPLPRRVILANSPDYT